MSRLSDGEMAELRERMVAIVTGAVAGYDARTAGAALFVGQQVADALLPTVERIVAARVEAAVAPVLAAAEQLEGQGFFYGGEVIRAALASDTAPQSVQQVPEVAQGHGDADRPKWNDPTASEREAALRELAPERYEAEDF